MKGGDLVAEELRAHVKLTGDQQFKAGMKGIEDSTDRAGDSVEGLGKDMGFLAARAAEAEASVKDLIKELDQTGDVDLLKKIRKGKREQRLFENLAKELQGELQDAAGEAAGAATGAGGIIGEGLAKGIGAAIAAGGPYLIGGLAAMAAAALPFLGGVVASAVIGGTGIGGIAGGLMLASKDARVQGAASELAEVASTAFSRAAEPFVGSAVDALDLLGRASQDIARELEPAFKGLAPLVRPLTEGLVGMVEEMLPGLKQGMEAAKPVIRGIANELPEIGEAVGDFVRIISEDADGAVMAFAALSDIIQTTLRFTAAFIRGMEETYAWAVRAANVTSGVMTDLLGWVPLVGDTLQEGHAWTNELLDDLDKSGSASRDFAGDLEDVGDAASDAAEEIKGLQDAMDAAFGKTMDLERSTMAYHETLAEMMEVLRDGAKTLDVTTEAGRENRDSILDQVQAVKNLRDANIDNNMGIDDANALYEQQIENIRRSAIQLGFNKQQVDALIASWKGMPAAVETEYRYPGLLAAIEKSRELARLLGSTSAAAAATSGSYVSGRASGGPVMAGQTYVVGENGPEVLQMGATSGYVYNAGETAAMMSGASGGAAVPTVNVVVSVKPGVDGAIGQAIASYLQFEVQTTGEGDAQLYFAGR